ncbi:MAG: hypothetical protein QOG65_2840, partial [Actinomycetota bacterium]|nr:hypothetical protein [Actinomycetota bacterium]
MRFGVLGPLEVYDDRGPLALGKPQQRAVLAMLVLDANRVVSLDRIVEDMWEGNPPARAAGTVHACISILRRTLEPNRSARAAAAVLVSQAPGYLLRVEPDDIDSLRFERLVADAKSLTVADPEQAITTFDAALALWRGPALADFAASPWAAVAATRLEEIRNSVAEDRFDALLAAGHTHGVVADLEAAVALSPLRERLWSQLIVALYRSGRQADALRTYQRARTVLAEELGIEPGPELQSLERQVLEQSSELNASRREPSAPLTTPPEQTLAATARGTEDTESIFGRERELLSLRTAVANLREGVGAAIAVTGAAGAGKTRLVEVALGDGPDQVRVMWARCVQGDIAPALWPWLQFAAALGNDGTELADAIRTEPGTSPPSENAQRLMYEAAVNALTRLGPPPVVLVIDDAHWADVASLHIVQLLVSRLPDLALLLMLTVRDSDHSSSETSTTLAAIARSPVGHRTQLGVLDEGAIAQLLAARLGRPSAPEITALVHERSGGNAFYATELARLLAVDGDDPALLSRTVPASVRDVVSARVEALSDDARASLAAAAVLGRVFDTRIVQ